MFWSEALHDQTAPDLQQSRYCLLTQVLRNLVTRKGESFCFRYRECERAAVIQFRASNASFAKSESYRTEKMPVEGNPGKKKTCDRNHCILHPGDLAQFDATPSSNCREDDEQT